MPTHEGDAHPQPGASAHRVDVVTCRSSHIRMFAQRRTISADARARAVAATIGVVIERDSCKRAIRLTDLDARRAPRRARRLRARSTTRWWRAGLKLDLTRGKPSAEQLDLSNDLLHLPDGELTATPREPTCATTAAPLGLPELRSIFAGPLRVPGRPAARARQREPHADARRHRAGAAARRPRRRARRGAQEPISFLAPVPGYDRHFSICERYGIRLIAGADDRRGARRRRGREPARDRRQHQGDVVRPRLLEPQRRGVHRGGRARARLRSRRRRTSGCSGTTPTSSIT